MNWPLSFISELPVDFCIHLLNFFVFGDVMEEHHPSISTIDNNTVLYRDNILFVLPLLQKLSYNRHSIIMTRGFQWYQTMVVLVINITFKFCTISNVSRHCLKFWDIYTKHFTFKKVKEFIFFSAVHDEHMVAVWNRKGKKCTDYTTTVINLFTFRYYIFFLQPALLKHVVTHTTCL